MEVEELMNNMLYLFNNMDKALNYEKNKLTEKDLELTDLDHYIEFNVLTAGQHARVSKLRQTLRQERRLIKNNIEILETIKRFTDKYNNKLITGDIILNLKNQAETKQRQETRVYSYRTGILEKLKMVKKEVTENTDGNEVVKKKRGRPPKKEEKVEDGNCKEM